jgi:hypothetical protein
MIEPWQEIPRSTSDENGLEGWNAYTFTEHGATMAANVLNSPRAVQMSVRVVRAFVKMRSAFGERREFPRTQLLHIQRRYLRSTRLRYERAEINLPHKTFSASL